MEDDGMTDETSETEPVRTSEGDQSSAETAPGLPFPLDISIIGFREDLAQELGDFIVGIVKEMTVMLDLSALEKLWITSTYAETLASIDRGFDTSTPLAPTKEGFAVGVAMVIHVKRGDVLKCHVVIDLGVAVSARYAEDEAHRRSSAALIVHELGHVHDFGALCQMMPDVMLRPLPNTADGWLYSCIHTTWSEYIASFVAAPFDEGAINSLMETFLNALAQYPEDVRQAIIAYRRHHDIGALLKFVNQRFGALFKFAAYVIGHLERLEQSLSNIRQDEWQIIMEAGFSETWNKLEQALFAMHDEYPNWTGLDAYAPLNAVFKEFLETRGIKLVSNNEGFGFSIPFTRDTVPPDAVALFDLGLPL